MFTKFVCLSLLAVQSFGAVVHLTESTFAQTIDGSKNALVEFYAPWCGHCKNLAPEWAIAGDTFQPTDDIIIAAVDATEAPELSSAFGIQGYPTIKYFPKGSDMTSPEDYEGGRVADEIVSWVNSKIGTSRRVKKAPSAVTVLDDSNFDAVVMNPEKDVVVKFYAPWCGHCKSMAPHYEKLAGVFAGDEDVVVAHLDATEYSDFGDRFDVQGYPTVKFFGKDKKTEPQDFNAREIEDMVAILNEMSGKFRTSDGGLTAEAGRISSLDAIVESATTIDEEVVTNLNAAAAELEDADKKNAAVYIAAAKKIIAKGADYIAKEIQRVTGIIDGDSVTPTKKTAFMIKRNVLAVFAK